MHVAQPSRASRRPRGASRSLRSDGNDLRYGEMTGDCDKNFLLVLEPNPMSLRTRFILPTSILALALVAGCGFRRVAPSCTSGCADLGPTPVDLAAATPDLVGPVTSDLLDSSGLTGVQGVGSTTVATVDLSKLGTVDWVHWGYPNSWDAVRKSGVTQRIGSFASISGNGVTGYTNSVVSFGWTDGAAPNQSVASTASGVFLVGQGDGFTLTVPAGLEPQTLELYVAGYQSAGELHAYLSDIPDQDYTDRSFARSGTGIDGQYNATYTLRFRSRSANQTLSLQWRAYSLSAADGNVALQAAALH
jgi:hypothetical protein